MLEELDSLIINISNLFIYCFHNFRCGIEDFVASFFDFICNLYRYFYHKCYCSVSVLLHHLESCCLCPSNSSCFMAAMKLYITFLLATAFP